MLLVTDASCAEEGSGSGKAGSVGLKRVCFLGEENHAQGWACCQQVGLSWGKLVLPGNLGLGMEGALLAVEHLLRAGFLAAGTIQGKWCFDALC